MKTKNLVCRASIVLLVLVCMSFQAKALDDLPGWQNTKWGMTEQEVARALGNEAVKVGRPLNYYRLYVPMKVPVKIGAFMLEAMLQFSDQTKTLRQVLIRGSSDSIELWAELRDLLTDKYGTPIQVGTKREWRFKTTIVELDRLSIPGVIGQITVRYYPAALYKDDKLKL